MITAILFFYITLWNPVNLSIELVQVFVSISPEAVEAGVLVFKTK